MKSLLKATSFVLISIMHLLGGYCYVLNSKNCSLKISSFFVFCFGFSVRLLRLQSCDLFKTLCCVTSVPYQHFTFSTIRSSISSFNKDLVFVKISTITNRKYLKGTIGWLHFSFFTFFLTAQNLKSFG